jgi:hypothetical protein
MNPGFRVLLYLMPGCRCTAPSASCWSVLVVHPTPSQGWTRLEVLLGVHLELPCLGLLVHLWMQVGNSNPSPFPQVQTTFALYYAINSVSLCWRCTCCTASTWDAS